MTVKKSDLGVGKCYVRPSGQVRRITKLTPEKVTYESRGKRAISGPWNPRVTANIETFLGHVDREVPCDFDADYAPDSRV